MFTTTGDGTARPVRRTADGLTITFRVLDGHRPTDDSASATFADDRITVTGTRDPAGCDRPILSAVHYNTTDGVINLKAGTAPSQGPLPTVECGNASYDYRCEVTADRSQLGP